MSSPDDPSIDSPSREQTKNEDAHITLSEFKYEIERQRDIYEDEIIALNEELEHIKTYGNRIIAEKIEPYRVENGLLRAKLVKSGLMEEESPDNESEKKAMH